MSRSFDRELRQLRDEIEAADDALIASLNRRFELVSHVYELKDEAGTAQIDAEREADLLRRLAARNTGPLSTNAMASVFEAVLDVMKHELRGEPGRKTAEEHVPRAPVARLAIVGTGLIGTSVALAAKRAGVAQIVGWDVDADALREAARAGAVEAAESLARAAAGAELVVVSVPVGRLSPVVADVLAAAPEATVTDVGSTKRILAPLGDPRLVPGHPVAGGSTSGPRGASADLFRGATWFLSPLPATEPDRLSVVERFVASLGAHPVRMDPGEHDRLMALTSHLPHALANILIGVVAREGDERLRHAGPSLREMTRVAGANPPLWADIFSANADLLVDVLATFRGAVQELEQALREGDFSGLERQIQEAAATRSRMLEHAYRTAAGDLQEIRVRVPDRPGALARITQELGGAGINIEDFELHHISPEYGGVLVLVIAGTDDAMRARRLLQEAEYPAA